MTEKPNFGLDMGTLSKTSDGKTLTVANLFRKTSEETDLILLSLQVHASTRRHSVIKLG